MYVDVTLVGSVLGILVILGGAIAAILGIYNRVVLSLNKININLEQLNADMVELKGYKSEIDDNKKAIVLLQKDKLDKSVYDKLQDDFLIMKTQHDINHKKKE